MLERLGASRRIVGRRLELELAGQLGRVRLAATHVENDYRIEELQLLMPASANRTSVIRFRRHAGSGGAPTNDQTLLPMPASAKRTLQRVDDQSRVQAELFRSSGPARLLAASWRRQGFDTQPLQAGPGAAWLVSNHRDAYQVWSPGAEQGNLLLIVRLTPPR